MQGVLIASVVLMLLPKALLFDMVGGKCVCVCVIHKQNIIYMYIIYKYPGEGNGNSLQYFLSGKFH